MVSSLIFVVDDDPWYSDLLEHHILKNPEFRVEKFTSGKECLKSLYKNPLAITLDYNLPDMNGREVLKKIRESRVKVPVIIISGQEEIKTAVELLKMGAYDYLIKDQDTFSRMWSTLRNIRDHAETLDEIEHLREEVLRKYDFSRLIIGNSPAIRKVFTMMEKAVEAEITVSITGETGTGKEMVAKAIHYNSARGKKPFVAINVGAIPAELIESELFGHEKGAFTGAIARRAGKFEEAHKGTIFLDEIAEMDLNMQAKLLRVLQEREVTPIGGNRSVKIDVRVITATHKDLAEEVRLGRFRADLFYRLAGLPIRIPPLRDRGNDIMTLAKRFSEEFCKANKRHKVTFSPEAQDKLLRHSYPGNIRELKSAVELAVIMADSGNIGPNDITFTQIDSLGSLFDKEMSLDEYNREIVRHYLEKYDHRVAEAAVRLKVGKSTLYRMIKEYGLQ